MSVIVVNLRFSIEIYLDHVKFSPDMAGISSHLAMILTNWRHMLKKMVEISEERRKSTVAFH